MKALCQRFIKDVKTAPELPVVAVKLPTGAIETIVNTSKLADKIQYYMEAYDDEFRLKLIQQSRLYASVKGGNYKVIIAIDGASRRNGKPDCLSVGSVFCVYDGTFGKLARYEKGSTNQRGELIALVNALDEGLYCCRNGNAEEVMLITDSEYIYNCLTKEWYINWQIKGWVTAEGNPVKNKDLWVKAAALLEQLHDEDFEISVFHIKGHLVPVGKATARKTIEADPSLKLLYDLVQQKYDEAEVKYADKFTNARELFRTNHGYDAPTETFREMIVCNTVADLYAGYYADKIDSGSVV